MAVPLAPARAILEIIEGSRASSKLTPVKKTASRIINGASSVAQTENPSAAKPTVTMPPIKTCLMRPRPSAMMTNGTIANRPSSSTGR